MANSEFRKKSLTPIALFAYNRPRHVERALGSLTRCARLEECRLHVYCDGPRDAADFPAVTETRRVIDQRAKRLGAQVIERADNLGLARSVVGGVTDLCREYGRVVVLEDDLEVGAGFLDYMLQALDRYQAEGNIYQISGYMFPVEHPPHPDAFFLPLTTTWGWATWDRAWEIFNWRAIGALERLADPAARRHFDLGDSYPYARMLEDRLAGRNDSWGILWWWAVFQAGGLALHPRRSLVWNRGFDGSGTHCGVGSGDDPAVQGEERHFCFEAPIKFPPGIRIEDSAFARITEFLKKRQHRRQPTVAYR